MKKASSLCPFFFLFFPRETASEREALFFRGDDLFFSLFFLTSVVLFSSFSTPLFQVAADSKFVDLGADSLDTVEIMMALEVRRETLITFFPKRGSEEEFWRKPRDEKKKKKLTPLLFP